jgi:hypothetical protein
MSRKDIPRLWLGAGTDGGSPGGDGTVRRRLDFRTERSEQAPHGAGLGHRARNPDSKAFGSLGAIGQLERRGRSSDRAGRPVGSVSRRRALGHHRAEPA